MCSTLRRVCRHIADFSPRPGYVPFAADRLGVLAGELCDGGDSYLASGSAQPAARGPPQPYAEREGKETVEKKVIPDQDTEKKASSGTGTDKEVEKVDKEQSHRGQRKSKEHWE